MKKEYILTEEQAKVAGIPKKEIKALLEKNRAELNNQIIQGLIENGSQTALRLLYGIINLDNPKEIYTGKGQIEIDTEDKTIQIVCTPKTEENIEKL